jgi:hypothetical protein
MQTPRSIKRVRRHTELLKLMLIHPNESKAAMEALGVNSQLSQKQERKLFHEIKGRVNGSDHS